MRADMPAAGDTDRDRDRDGDRDGDEDEAERWDVDGFYSCYRYVFC